MFKASLGKDVDCSRPAWLSYTVCLRPSWDLAKTPPQDETGGLRCGSVLEFVSTVCRELNVIQYYTKYILLKDI